MGITVKPIDKNYIQPALTKKFKSHLDISSKVFFLVHTVWVKPHICKIDLTKTMVI